MNILPQYFIDRMGNKGLKKFLKEHKFSYGYPGQITAWSPMDPYDMSMDECLRIDNTFTMEDYKKWYDKVTA